MKATVQLKPHADKREVSKGGLFRSAKTVDVTIYDVAVFVEFSDEERAVLTQFNLWDTPLWMVPSAVSDLVADFKERGVDLGPTEVGCPIHVLADPRGAHRYFDTSEEAIDFQNEVKTKHLPRLKELITKHQIGPTDQSETLEF